MASTMREPTIRVLHPSADDSTAKFLRALMQECEKFSNNSAAQVEGITDWDAELQHFGSDSWVALSDESQTKSLVLAGAMMWTPPEPPGKERRRPFGAQWLMRLLLVHPDYEGKGVEKALWNKSLVNLRRVITNPDEHVFIYVHSDELNFFGHVGYRAIDTEVSHGMHRYLSAKLKDLQMCE